MKQILLTVALAGLGGAAFGQDWSGTYVGLQGANASFSNTYFIGDVPSVPALDGGGSMTGLYAGYNHQLGNVVLGGELSYLAGEPEFDDYPGYFFDGMVDLKARAGYSVGKVLPYAVLGWSKTQWVNETLAPVDADGFSYGLGVEYKVTDRVMVGFEYLKRDLVAENWVEAPDQHIEGDFSTIALRVGMSF